MAKKNREKKVGVFTVFILISLFTNILTSPIIGFAYSDNQYASSIEDNAVYFLVNAANTSITLDVPNCNYNDGTNMIAWTSLGWGNQRFILRKQFNYTVNNVLCDTYRMIPLDKQEKVLAIQDDSDLSNKFLQVQSERYSDAKLMSDKYIFQYHQSTNSFKILTGASSFTKCLALNGSSSSGTQIIQTDVVSNNDSMQRWKLIKTDTLGMNNKREAYIVGTNSIRYNLTIPQAGTYVIETLAYENNNVSTFLSLNTTSNSTIVNTQNNSTQYAAIEYTFNSPGDYSIVLRGKNQQQMGNVYINFRPKKEIYINTIWDPVLQLDNVSGILNTRGQWAQKGYFLNVLANIDKTSIYETLPTNQTKMNNDYYVFWGHGNPDGVFYYNGLTSDDKNYLRAIQLPSNLNNLKEAVWVTCGGAGLNNINGYYTSMARETVVRGADYSIGWRGDLGNGGVWLMNYFDALFNNYSGVNAAYQATLATRRDLWPMWQAYLAGNDNNDIWNPIVYYRNVTGNIVYSVANDDYLNVYNDDGGRLNRSISQNDYENNLVDNNFNNSSSDDHFKVLYSNYVYKLVKIGDVITNIIDDESQNQILINNAKEIINNYKASDDFIDNATLYIFEVNGFLEGFTTELVNQDMQITHLRTHKRISVEEFMNIANSNF